MSIYVVKFQTVIRMSMNYMFTPQDDAHKAEQKAFTEKFLLHRTVGIKLDRHDDMGNFSGRVFHPAGNIAAEILKQGISKLVMPKDIDYDPDYYKELKAAQLIAQSR